MDKRTNTPHDDFSVEEILQEARLLREQQGEEITFSVATTDQKPASERAQATPVEQDAKAVAQQPVMASTQLMMLRTAGFSDFFQNPQGIFLLM